MGDLVRRTRELRRTPRTCAGAHVTWLARVPESALARRATATGLVSPGGTPPRSEGCRPASRDLTLALLTELGF
ncbi:hypothetical protein AKJ09_09191 [Labilithrix luteola]|uniref:Uncharacterized protein n=1 Tax=Labilithrix luteola TaxID=1391654 RepID=A0A0K1Q9W9_9BACT|nr:hypothetical protein AKJ09_09191 [Labilithrix luteola]